MAQGVIVDAVVAAWDHVQTGEAARTHPPEEVSITLELQRRLNEMLNDEEPSVPGFTSSMFETVVRGGEIENADSTSLERRPDLTFRLQGKSPLKTAREHYALFTECKVVDRSRSLKGYCDTGLRRFITCEYAWAMPHALMIAYSESETTPGDLASFLSSSTDCETIGVPTVDAPPPSVLRSKHGRNQSGAAAPSGPVDITHLWLPLVAGSDSVE
jgi:hypothetical protein